MEKEKQMMGLTQEELEAIEKIKADLKAKLEEKFPRFSFEDKVAQALEENAKVLKMLSDSVRDLQRYTLDLSEKQLGIIAALAQRGISINTKEIKEMLNDASSDPKSH